MQHGWLPEAERRAAALYGADVCRFSAGGSTHCNQALALSVGVPGDVVVVSRTLHRSLLLGLVLAGLEPVWVEPEVSATTGLPLGYTPQRVAQALGAGADATITSAHKTLPAYSQAAPLLARTERLDASRWTGRSTRCTPQALPGRSWPAWTRRGRCFSATANGSCHGPSRRWPRHAQRCGESGGSRCWTATWSTRPSSPSRRRHRRSRRRG
jgi:arginine/lysine/ornithine decarboxylase